MSVTQGRLSGWKIGGWQKGVTGAYSLASNPQSQGGFLLIMAIRNHAEALSLVYPRQIITVILASGWQLECEGNFWAFLLSTGIFKRTHSCFIWRRKKMC